MSKPIPTHSLLPPGCYDCLPPEAGAEAALVWSLCSSFIDTGYQLVSPPLLEYTENLLAGRGAGLAPYVLRMVDPSSNRVMGVRADMTMQIARMVKTRFAAARRPLRLAYAGSVLRLRGDSLEESRQLRQIGVERIGDGPGAVAEVVFVSLRALDKSGVKGVTVDLHFPSLIEAVSPSISPEAMDAIATKDAGRLAGLSVVNAELLSALMLETGAAAEVLPRLKSMNLPQPARSMIEELDATAAALAKISATAKITVDVTDRRGFDYYSGITFFFFADGGIKELGRGGRYMIGDEPAVGCSFFAERLLALVPPPPARPMKFVADFDERAIEAAISEGYIVILGES